MATKAMLTLYKQPGMSGEEFREYWRTTHAPIAAKMPGLRSYVQYHGLETDEGEPAVAGIAELHFDSPEAMQEAFASPEGEAAVADLPNFSDPEKMETVIVETVEVV